MVKMKQVVADIEADQFDILEIYWRDHYTTEDWHGVDSSYEECIIKTIGYLVNEDNLYYHIAQSITDDECNNVWSILKDEITKIRNLSQ